MRTFQPCNTATSDTSVTHTELCSGGEDYGNICYFGQALPQHNLQHAHSPHPIAQEPVIIAMDTDEFDNLWNADSHAKLPQTMPAGTQMLRMDENGVVQFVPYFYDHTSNDATGEASTSHILNHTPKLQSHPRSSSVWHACCAVWSKPFTNVPFQMTLGFSRYANPHTWATIAEDKAIKYLQDPKPTIRACRCVLRCISEGLQLIDSFSLDLFVEEAFKGRLIQNKLKGLLRPLLRVYYHNDPSDHTNMLEVVTQEVIDIVATKRQRMPLVNRNALDAYYARLNDGQDEEDDQDG